LKKIGLLAFVLLLLSTAVVLGFVRPAVAQGTIYIRADGNVDPQTAPIQRDGDLYTLTGNITSDVNGIVIERDDMTFNGAGYSIQGTEQAYDYYFDYKGIDMSGRSNVTIKNTSIKGFTYGIHINSSSHNTLFGNKITNNRYGVFLCDSSYNIIFGNNMTANEYYGIFLSNSSYNCISENEVIGNFDAGIFLTIYSSCNVISGNYIKPRGGGVWIWQYSKNNSFIGNIVENRYAIDLSLCSNNHIYGNSFVNNTVKVSISNSTNLWDNGFEGNYWSDYNGKDTDGDGVGDTPYIIDENNQDNYPLMDFPNPQEQMRILYYDSLRKFDELLANHNNLKANYNNLNATYNELESLQETTMGELNYIRNIMYIFIITTIALIATTAYFAIRRPKVKPESRTA